MASANTGESGPEVIKPFSCSAQLSLRFLNAYKYKNIKKFGLYSVQISLKNYFFPLINVKMPTIVGILTYMSKKNVMLS